MNWFMLAQAISYVVVGIEAIHKGAAGATKKDLALQSLGLAKATATAVIPGQAATIGVVSDAAGSIIDATVKAFNAVGWPSTDKPGMVPSANGTTATAPLAPSMHDQEK